MMRILVFGLACLFIGAPVGGQESLPMVAQCQVDLKYFGAQAERALVQRMSAPDHTSDLDRLSAKELRRRSIEMLACAAIDSDKAGSYEEQSYGLDGIVEEREYNFLKRHHLLSEFYSDDSKGLR